jgi:hypothetical protein
MFSDKADEKQFVLSTIIILQFIITPPPILWIMQPAALAIDINTIEPRVSNMRFLWW